MQLWMIGGDARSAWAAKYLREAGHTVSTYGVDGIADSPLPPAPQTIVLPFPALDGACVRGSRRIALAEVCEHVGVGTHIFGGCLGALGEMSSARGAVLHDLYGAEPLTTANAALTAEAALGLAIAHSAEALGGAACLVIGFGRIGKLLALKLRALNAEVTVAVRSAQAQGLAEAFGCQTDRTARYRRGLGGYSFVFNTVPAPILRAEQLAQTREDCLLVDLSSAPFGIPPEACRAAGRECLYAPGLPGRFSPKSAGILYARQLISEAESEGIL